MFKHTSMLSRLSVLKNHLSIRPLSSTTKFTYPKLPQVTLNLDKAEAEVIVPGYSYGDLDRMGHISLNRVGWVADLVDFCVHSDEPTMQGLSLAYPDHLFFVVAADQILSTDFYCKKHYSYPLLAKVQVYLRKSSYVEVMHFHSTADGSYLYTTTLYMVCVDKETHRPVPLPLEFREKCSRFALSDYKQRIEPFPRGKNAHCVSYKVNWGTTDFYQHTNQSEYVRFIMDVANELSLEGSLKFFKGDIASYKVKGWKQLYMGECLPGSLVDVVLWEEDSKPNYLFCHMESDGKCIHQCVIEFC